MNNKECQEVNVTSLDTKNSEIDFEYKNQELTPLLYHEALDRTFFATKIVSDMLVDHPVYHQNKNLKSKLEKSLELLDELYQEIPNLNGY